MTTAPPVASAEKTLIISWASRSTRDTPDTAASPTDATIIESARPTVMARPCSIISGQMSFVRDLRVNRGFASSSMAVRLRQ